MMDNFQLLMLSSNLLKYQIPWWGAGGVHDGQLPTFDAESKSPKIPNLLGGGGCMMANFQLLMLSPNLLKSQICWEGGCMTANFQLLMLSPNLLKSQIPWWGGGVHDGQLPTFDAESKSAKIPNCLGGGGGGGCMMANFQLQTFLESKSAQIPKSIRGRGEGGVNDSQVC